MPCNSQTDENGNGYGRKPKKHKELSTPNALFTGKKNKLIEKLFNLNRSERLKIVGKEMNGRKNNALPKRKVKRESRILRRRRDSSRR